MGIFTKNKKSKDKKNKKEKTKKTGKKEKKKSKKKQHQNSESSSSSSDSDKKQKGIPSNQNEVQLVDQKFKMAGALQNKPKNPVDYPKKLMQSEYRQMFNTNSNLSNEECMLLDDFLKKKAELRSSDLMVVCEKLVDEEKKSNRLKIVTKYDEGRFGAIYVVQREAAVDDNVVANSPFMIMKTALRNLSSPEVCARLTREIRILTQFCSADTSGRRIPTIQLEGRVLGVPFFVIPLMDVNLEKCREDINGFFSPPAAFYIAQEVLMAMKFIHSRGFLHRDIKPTNIVLNAANRNQWFLIDFGECVQANKSIGQSPPDGYGLPFISRETHELLNTVGKNTFIQDLESWFYVFLDMIRPLSWRELIVLPKVHKIKTKFWEDVEASLPSSDYPPQVLAIAKLLSGSRRPEPPYKEFSQLLESGFVSLKESDWKADWLNREEAAIRNKPLKERYEAQKSTLADSQRKKVEKSTRNKSIYCAVTNVPSEDDVGKTARGQKSKTNNSMYGSAPVAKPSSTKMAKIVEDDPLPTKAASKMRQNLSVYMDVNQQVKAKTPNQSNRTKRKYKT